MTRYEELVTSVSEEENLQFLLIDGMGQDDILEFRFYAAGDRAWNASMLAQAEQQRIANLIALARADGMEDFHLSRKQRHWALDEAMKALGVPE